MGLFAGLAQVLIVITLAGVAVGPPNLLKTLTTGRHWQVYETFSLKFQQAAERVGKRDAHPAVAQASVSRRQFERWIAGTIETLPRPGQCRVLEELFGFSATELFDSAEKRPFARSPESAGSIRSMISTSAQQADLARPKPNISTASAQ